MNKVLFIMGTILLLVPYGLRIWDDKKQEDVVADYQKDLTCFSANEMEEGIISAREYNQSLFNSKSIDLTRYGNELNFFGNGMMGSLEISKISLKLPIYHGASENVLAGGVGHLKESSLPVGGADSHCVLTGHRGLPHAQLFTRLDELEKGDVFSITVCNQTLNYCVSKIVVVTPEDTESLKIQEGEDMVSLVTCTPYGINTHRLVVTGKRITEKDNISNPDKSRPLATRDFCFLAMPILFGGISVIRHRKRGKKL